MVYGATAMVRALILLQMCNKLNKTIYSFSPARQRRTTGPGARAT